MGNLLRLLSKGHDQNEPTNDIFVDFEKAQPTESELETYQVVEKVLLDAKEILLDMQTYKGAGDEIREAIGNPREEDVQRRAWNTVVPLVNKLAKFYSFSLTLSEVVPKLLGALCSGPLTPWQHLEQQQALVKQFAEILDFVLKFDDLKMTNPAIQNDFSYYRRTVNRLKLDQVDQEHSPLDKWSKQEIPNELANRMSLFYANATPMLKVVSDTTSKFAEKQQLVEQTTETLGTIAKVCQRMIDNQALIGRFENGETVLFVLRVMVGVIILYDHVHPTGAFAKSSHIDIKSCVKVLKEQPLSVVEALINALRYTTKHLQDDSTPKQTKSLLA